MTFRNLAYGVLLFGLSSLASCGGDGRPSSLGEGGTSNTGGHSGAFSFGGNHQGGNAGSSEGGSGGSNDPGDGGVNGGEGGEGGTGGTSGTGGSPPLDVDSGTTAVYTVPVGGGTLTLNTTAGTTITFDFPTSAIGKQVTFTPSSSEDIGWPEGTFAAVIQMEPDGLEFAEPVRVSLGDGSLMLLNFPTLPVRSAPEPLALASDGQALELTHFSSLAILAAEQSCGPQSGWVDTAGSQLCQTAGAGKTTYRSFNCNSHYFCYAIDAGCCVAPGTAYAGCHTGDTNLTLAYARTETNGVQYSYCFLPASDAGLDAGAVEPDASATTPYVQNHEPQQFVAGGGDQALTLHGSNFDPTGTIFIQLDFPLTTVWVSSGEASAIVPAQYLVNPGALSQVGFVNSAPGGAYDWQNRSNTSNIPIVAGDGGTTPPVDASVDASIGDDASSPAPDASLVLPVVTDFAPATLPSNQGDQTVTLYGTGFDPNGTGFYWLDFAATTVAIGPGEVQLLVPESALAQAAINGTLNDVGYVNPDELGNNDWPNRSNTVNIQIVDADAGN